MAVAMEGFSIREYASRMRSIDVSKCWPFDEAKEEVVRAVLPPIAVKKFSWWFDELRLVEDCEEGFDLDSESLQSMRMRMGGNGKGKSRAKARAPKKRSIVELFAAAPEVERINSDDENGSDEEDGIPGPKLSSFGNVGLNLKGKRRVKKKGILSMLVNKEKIVMIKDLKKDKPKKLQKGKKIAVDLRIIKKNKTSKLRRQASADIVMSSNGATYGKDLFGAISTHSKKPRLKRLSTERMKCKISSTTKFLPRDQQVIFPVHGILKNQNKIVLADNSSNPILQDACKLSHCSTQQADKHVTFSVEDDILEPRSKACHSMELELQSFCNLYSDVGDASMVNGHAMEMMKSLAIKEMKETEKERSKCSEDIVDFQHVTGKQFPGRHYVSDAGSFILRQHGLSQPNLFRTTVPFGQGPLHGERPWLFEGFNRVTLHDGLHSFSSEIPSLSREPCMPKMTIPMFNYSSDASFSSQRLTDFSGNTRPQLDSDCSLDVQKAYPEPPTAYLPMLHGNSNNSHPFPSQNIRENKCERGLSYQWIPHLPPKELMHTICSLPDWNSRVSLCGETSMNKDFIGLPLNSLGEFISLNSSGKDGYNHIRSMSNIPGPSFCSALHNNVLNGHMVKQVDTRSWNEMIVCKNQQKTCRIKDSGEEIDCFSLPSRRNMVEQYDIGRRNTMTPGDNPYFCSMVSDMDRMKVSQIECRPHDQVQEHPGERGKPDHVSLHVTRSTMRLMGKEFTIGGRDFEGIKDRDVWTNKQIVTDHCGNNTTESSSFKGKDLPRFVVHPILGKLEETVAEFSKGKMDQVPEGVQEMIVSESKVSSHFLDLDNSVINNSDGRINKEILMPEIYPHFSLASSPSPDSNRSTMQGTFSRSYISPPVENSWNVSRSNVGPGYKQTPLHAAQFALKFPFSDAECARPIHPSWYQNSFKFMSPRVLESRQKGTLMDYHQPYSAPGSICYPCHVSGTNYGTDASFFSRPEPFYLSPCSPSPTTVTSASLAHHPSVPVNHGLSMPNRQVEKDKQLKSRLSFRIPTFGQRSKKRLQQATNGSKKSSKIPKIGVREYCSCAVTQIETGNSFQAGDDRSSKEVSEPASTEKNSGTSELGQHKVREYGLGDCTKMDAFKPMVAPISGSIKLTAGARYKLKPCQKSDQVNSGRTESTIPVVSSTCDPKDL